MLQALRQHQNQNQSQAATGCRHWIIACVLMVRAKQMGTRESIVMTEGIEVSCRLCARTRPPQAAAIQHQLKRRELQWAQFAQLQWGCGPCGQCALNAGQGPCQWRCCCPSGSPRPCLLDPTPTQHGDVCACDKQDCGKQLDVAVS